MVPVISILTFLTYFVHSYMALQRNGGFLYCIKIQNTTIVLFLRT